jgi:hypothetical protein
MKITLLVCLLLAGSSYSQDSLLYKAAIFDVEDSSLVLYVLAPESYIVSKEQLVLNFDREGKDSLVTFTYDDWFLSPLKMYNKFGHTGITIYLNHQEQRNLLLNSGFKYTLLRPFRVEDYYFVNEEHGVVIRSVEIDQVVNAEYNKRVEKILMIRNSKNLMKL